MTSGFGKVLTGLSDAEAAGRLAMAGPNLITTPGKVSFLGILREEVTERMILLLLSVGFFYSIWGRLEDALTIFGVILLICSAAIFWQEVVKVLLYTHQLDHPEERDEAAG